MNNTAKHSIGKRVFIVSAVVFFLLFALIMTVIFFRIKPQTVYGHINEFGFWEDTRERNDVHFQYNSNRIFRWNDEYLEDCEKYRLTEFESVEYLTHASLVPDSSVSEKLGSATAYDYAINENNERFTEHKTDVEIYSINGVTRDLYIAVRFPENEKYYLYSKNIYTEEEFPKTLGEFLDNFSPQNHLPLGEFYSYENDNETGRFMLSEEGSRKIWEILGGYRDAEISETYIFSSDSYVSFAASSDEYGCVNNAFSIHENGYVATNAIRQLGLCFFIGEEATEKIMSVIDEYTISDMSGIPDYFVIKGRVTEVGDDYFKIDDSICMRNSDEGVVFTVKTDDITIMRYFLSGMIKVGSLILVEYDGRVDLETYTVTKVLGIETGLTIIEGDRDIILE